MNMRIVRMAGLLPLLVLWLMVGGCGGANSTAGKNSRGRATARFLIHWPDSVSRAIPAGTNRIIIYINGPDILGSLAYVIDKPNVGSSTTISDVEITAGSKRLFSVDARQVVQAKYPNLTRLDYLSPELLEGTRLGAGNDAQAHDVGIGETISAAVTVAEAGQPSGGTTDVKVTVNQVITNSFPSVLVLQLIRDQNGVPITNLNAGNFDVTEDGKPVAITDVRTVQQAASNMSVGLVLDRSGSMSGTPTVDLEQAATQFVGLMQTNDFAEVVNFDDRVEVTQPFTANQSLLVQAIQNQLSRFGNGTALYDGIFQGIVDTAARGGRMAVIAMTDGVNNSGSHTRNQVIQSAKQQGLPVFTIGLGDVDVSVLNDIATQTGGLYTFAPSSSDLSNIYRTVANQLNGQIQLSFISPDPVKSGRLRHVIVRYHYGNFTGQAAYDYTL